MAASRSKASRSIKVMHVGLGPIGIGVVKQVAERKGFTIVSAVDVDAAKVGRDLGEVAGLGRRLGVAVSASARIAARAGGRPDVAVLCTGSSLRAVKPHIEELLELGVSVVSTTEELAYPTRANLRYARAIDRVARETGTAVLGTGVNPGFAMDALPIALTGVCERVDAVRVERVQDARIRRLPFQRKIGAGLTIAEFQAEVAAGRVRHVGLSESAAMIADALGWRLERVTDEITPRIADARVTSEFLAVERGEVCGLVQDGVGYREGRPVITLHMEAYLGAPRSYDAVEIHGSPELRMTLEGGIHGDVATTSIVVNSLPRILEVAPGLHTMRDMPLPSLFAGVRSR